MYLHSIKRMRLILLLLLILLSSFAFAAIDAYDISGNPTVIFDADSDRISDEKDECPNTSALELVNEKGCTPNDYKKTKTLDYGEEWTDSLGNSYIPFIRETPSNEMEKGIMINNRDFTRTNVVVDDLKINANHNSKVKLTLEREWIKKEDCTAENVIIGLNEYSNPICIDDNVLFLTKKSCFSVDDDNCRTETYLDEDCAIFNCALPFSCHNRLKTCQNIAIINKTPKGNQICENGAISKNGVTTCENVDPSINHIKKKRRKRTPEDVVKARGPDSSLISRSIMGKQVLWPRLECYDKDGGLQINKSSAVIWQDLRGNYHTETDYCIGRHPVNQEGKRTLVEHYCKTKYQVGKKEIDCEGTCKDGACGGPYYYATGTQFVPRYKPLESCDDEGGFNPYKYQSCTEENGDEETYSERCESHILIEFACEKPSNRCEPIGFDCTSLDPNPNDSIFWFCKYPGYCAKVNKTTVLEPEPIILTTGEEGDDDWSICNDSDNGYNPLVEGVCFEKGKVQTTTINNEFHDECSNNNLIEYYCTKRWAFEKGGRVTYVDEFLGDPVSAVNKAVRKFFGPGAPVLRKLNVNWRGIPIEFETKFHEQAVCGEHKTKCPFGCIENRCISKPIAPEKPDTPKPDMDI
ncbi:hypothetical protein ACFLZN_00350 [Nanoarchaeota archaeon]